jgi:ADP-heptose:LPS heptosyltransferase
MNLVLRFSALGDVVLCSAFTQALEGETLFITSDSLKPFVEENFPGSIRVYGIPRPSTGLWGWFQSGLRFAGFMRLYAAPRIPVLRIYDLHNVTKSLLFTWGLMLGLRRSRIVAKLELRRSPKERLRRWILILFKKDIAPGRAARDSVFARHLSLLDTHQSTHTPSLRPSRRTLEFRPGQSELRLLVAPDAQHWKKIWPIEYWKAFLESLAKLETLQVHVTLVGSRPLINDDWIRDDLLRKFPYFSIKDLQGRTPISELPRIASEHHLSVCGNSAWLHICEAVGTPVLSLSGPIVPAFGFSPWRQDSHEVATELGCRPCTFHGDGICVRLSEPQACMTRLEPRLILQQMWRLLGYGSAPQ